MKPHIDCFSVLLGPSLIVNLAQLVSQSVTLPAELVSIFQMFCSPFRRRRKKKAEVFLTREEAWQMYFNKLDEEANYFTVTEETEEDICTCSTCIVSREHIFKYVKISRKRYLMHFLKWCISVNNS